MYRRGGKGKDHDGIVERHLAQREVRLSIAQMAPHEHHGGARSGGEQDETGKVGIDLLGRQPRRGEVRILSRASVRRISCDEPGAQRGRVAGRWSGTKRPCART